MSRISPPTRSVPTAALIVIAFLLAVAGARATAKSASPYSVFSPAQGNYTFNNGTKVRKVGPRSLATNSSHAEDYFDPFGDLIHVDPNSFFSESNKKKDFYKFSKENIEESRLKDWYAEWSQLYFQSPPETRTYEWEDFMSDIGGYPNFICTLTFGACTGAPSLDEIDRAFSGYPHHARRVYFVTQMYTILQARAKTIHGAYTRAQLYLTDHVAEVVHNMQLEPDESKTALCTLIHAVVEMGIQLTIEAIAAVGEAVAGIDAKQAKTLGQVGKEIGEMSTEMAERIQKLTQRAQTIKKITNYIIQGAEFAIEAASDPYGVPLQLTEVLQAEYKNRLPEILGACTNSTLPHCTEMLQSLNTVSSFFRVGKFGKIYRALLGYSRAGKGNPSAVYQPGNPWDNVYLVAGSDEDAMCNSFEGGLKVNSAHNIEQLKSGLSNKFAQMRDMLTGSFEEYYNGAEIFPGGMSETASIMKATEWAGVASTLSDMHMLTKWQNHFELQMTMQVASIMGAHDFSHVVCTSSKDAPELCAKAAQAEICTKAKGCLRSVFCPERGNPEIICKAQKWYGSSKAGGHITRFPSAEKWEPLMGNRYHLTQRKVLESVWEYYKAYQNDFNSLEATWSAKDNDIVSQAGGFHLPVCYKEGLDITENKFPASCGDWRSSDTELFMAASFMGPRAQLYNTNDGNSPGDLIKNVLPTIVDNKASSPLARYINFCQLHIRWPNTSDKEDPIRLFMMHRGQDKECGMIQHQTQSMDEVSANKWFCTVGYGGNAHTVFEREHHHIAVGPPLQYRYGHRHVCKRWMKTLGANEKEIEMVGEAGEAGEVLEETRGGN